MKQKSLFLLTILLAITLKNFSQDGIPFLSNYSFDQQSESTIWSIEQGPNGMMFFASRQGILSFDGNRWELIETPALAMQIKRIDNRLFVGCRNSFGELVLDNAGIYQFVSIIEENDSMGDITSILDDEHYVYFSGEKSIHILEKTNDGLFQQHFFDEEAFISDLFTFNNQIYFSQFGEGLMEFGLDSIHKVNQHQLFVNQELIAVIPLQNGSLLLGFDDNGLYTFDGNGLNAFELTDQEYLNESILVGGQFISNELIMLSTLNGGAIIINMANGETRFTINYQTGLPDDEVYSIGKDNNGGVWLSHEYGLTRIDMANPVRTYNYYPGLKGNLNDIIVYNNLLYVATSEGVFYLTEIKDYAEKEVTVKVKQKPKPAPAPAPVVEEEEEVDLSQLSRKERRRLKWNKVKEKIVGDIEESIIDVAKGIEKKRVEPQKQEEYRYVKKKIYSLQSISHGYKKVKDLDIKCKDLLIAKDKLLVTTNNGLFQIDKDSHKAVLEDVYVIDAYPHENKVFVSTDRGIFSVEKKEDDWQTTTINALKDTYFSLIVTSNEFLYAGGDNIIYKLDLNDSLASANEYAFNSDISLKAMVKKVNEKPLFFTRNGVFELKNDSLVPTEQSLLKNATDYIFSQHDRVWIKSEDSWYGLPESNMQLEINPLLLNFVSNIEGIYTADGEEVWAINSQNSVFRIESDIIRSKQFDVFFKSVENQEGEEIPLEDLRVDYTNSALRFTLSAPYFVIPESTQFQYFIKGLMNDWSEWSNAMEIDFPFIPPGNYDINIRAKNILGSKTEIKTISFSVKPPFWTAWWFYVLIILAFVVIAYIVFQLRLKKLQRDKRILEQKVKERTAEIQRQKDEILKQKEEIEASIMYAQRIQHAVLPPEAMIAEQLPDHFILFKPRDIVSGDFYWMKKIGHLTIITAADCTGHGVPGAFMSMLGMTMLNDIVRKKEVKLASHVLDELRNEIKGSLRQTGKEGEAKDGMDLALCVIDHKNKTMQYAGAYNPLYLYRNNELMEIKADRMPIGIHLKDTSPFTNHEIKLQKGDTFYMFSDGFVDQFGGPKGQKLKAKNFKQLLLENHQKSMKDQKALLDKKFIDWKGDREQVDDVLVIGIRI